MRLWRLKITTHGVVTEREPYYLHSDAWSLLEYEPFINRFVHAESAEEAEESIASELAILQEGIMPLEYAPIELYCPKCNSVRIETRRKHNDTPPRISMDVLGQGAYVPTHVARCVDCGYEVEYTE